MQDRDEIIRQAFARKKGVGPQGRARIHHKKVKYDGYVFDSPLERDRYQQLKILNDKGLIRDLKVHPRFFFQHPETDEYLKIRSQGYPNGRKVWYEADFSYKTGEGVVVEDTKGYDTQEARLKRAMVELFHGFKVRVLSRDDLKFRLVRGRGQQEFARNRSAAKFQE